MKVHSEAAFETVIEQHMLLNGYKTVAKDLYNKEKAFFPQTAIDFIKATQKKEWDRLKDLLGDNTEQQVINDLAKWMDVNGSLNTLRHGFKCYGRTLQIAYFKAAHTLNPELEDKYNLNIVGITRQLNYSTRNNDEKKAGIIDITLSLNGIPVATIELKNPMTGQNVENGKKQYREDRDPRELLFEFKKRTLVHFVVDTEMVFMTTRLAGSATYFLPLNKGFEGGAGNPANPHGRSYRTAYLWEEILERNSLIDLLARFIHLQVEEKLTDEGRKVKKESMIFPRYHQLDAVRKMIDTATRGDDGINCLVEHSAGSEQSNTIGWLAHSLASLHASANAKDCDSVVVITSWLI